MKDYSYLPLANISEMEDGDVAIMDSFRYKGRMVQRYGNSLISLNKGLGNSWSGIFNIKSDLECRIILRCNKK